ncbi:MAG TPA: ATP-grasp fold amidoligase family protein [Methylovirgula sp.]
MKIVPDWVFVIWEHWRAHGAFPNVLQPTTFCGKVLHRILFERSEWFTETTDKYRVRAYVEECLGADVLPKLLYVTDDPATIPFDDLPARFIVKPTHASGWFEAVYDKDSIDREKLIAQCREWLAQSFYEVHREWAYKNIVRRILVQELIDDGSGALPTDYRLYVFSGKPAFISVDRDQDAIGCCRFYDLSWRQLAVSNGRPEIAGDIPAPKHLSEMIQAAKILARNTTFVRIDFFDTEAQFYFVEMTWTPNCGLHAFHPPVYERQFGDLWKLDQGNAPPMRQSLRAVP